MSIVPFTHFSNTGNVIKSWHSAIFRSENTNWHAGDLNIQIMNILLKVNRRYSFREPAIWQIWAIWTSSTRTTKCLQASR